MAGKTISSALNDVATGWPQKVEIDEVSVTVTGTLKESAEEIEAWAIAALHESFGLEVPSAETLKKRAQERARKREREFNKKIADLRGGPDGIKR
ncbi:MAG: hypothetical protein K2Z81_04615, partial [Cyanobacteria bacterium]|nr:hypothetical protein [Cyanobacteriota bacterium]